MSSHILALPDPNVPPTTLRCHALASLLARTAELEGCAIAVPKGDPAAALAALASAGSLTGPEDPSEGGEIRYVPSPAARQRVGNGQDGAWSAAASRHRKVLRRTTGAVFAFPLEEQDVGRDEEALQVFTTDWSPTPAGCAVAVHPSHPYSAGLPAGHTAAFTHRFCRHPLTGDLIPVWTAAWVKPEFGTGAVLVNPGHDATDLAFAREVGLPVRFALAPADSDGGPQHWQSPPVTGTGQAVRTGSTDGLDPAAAQAEYFRIASARGLAQQHIDVGAGSFPIAVFAGAGAQRTMWDRERRTVADGARRDHGVPASVSVSAVLAAADPAVRVARLSVVAPSTAVETELLTVRLLLAEPGLGILPEREPEVLLVGPVVGKADGVAEDVLALAVLTGADCRDTLSLKPQIADTAERFLHTHTELTGGATGSDVDPAVLKAASQIKKLVLKADVKQAFTQLYRLQKTLAKDEARASDSLAVYEALTWALTGMHGSHPAGRLREDWQRIQ